jgi:GTP diphosphokinase / guanosine-3',5'-bis(diphosphate) 3'-diphosphatase
MKKKHDLSFETLKEKIISYNPKAKLDLIEKAYNFSKNVHEGQKRVSGEPYFVHVFETAMNLTDMKMGSTTICAGLLHDVVEDTNYTLKDIEKEFNKEIAMLVEGMTKISKMNFQNLDDYKSENIRRMILATTKDIRIILIKLADRLHNMRTLNNFREDKQKRIAKETIEIFAPIAHKLGMWNVKGELEDLSLRYIEPETYAFLRAKINEKRQEREKSTKDMIKTIKNSLKKINVDAVVYGRAKYFYSIYKKMIKKKVDFNEIYDLIGIRIITKTIPDCYAALGVVHELWRPFPKRFKDYIATPKANGYQSLHTAVVGSHGKILEIQIRTEDMHKTAEDGIAAHWKYQGSQSDKRFDKKISWLKQLLEWKQSSVDANEFVEDLKFDLFDKEIVVFTPKGDPIILPENSTPIDFAYQVHSNLGDKCSKVLINTKLMPLDTLLMPGDVIEIITTKNAKPSRNWLTFIKTSKARSKIRSKLGITAIDSKKQTTDDEITDNKLLEQIEILDKKINYPLKLSKCCSPKYKDEILAFLTKDKKITIHKKTCPNIHALENPKEIKVKWKDMVEKETTTLKISVNDRVGLLIDILKVISSLGINITHILSDTNKEHALISLKIETISKSKIKEAISKLRNMKDIIAVNELK